MGGKVVRSEGLGQKACVQYGGKNITKYIQYFLHLVLSSLCAFLLTVFVLRVLLSSYVYLFILCVFVLLYVYCCSYLRCPTAD